MKELAMGTMKRGSDLLKKPFPLEVIHIGEPANNMTLYHWHDFLEISHIQDGQGTYEIEDKVFPVAKGDMVVINGSERHRVTYDPKAPLYETVIHFSPQLIWSKENDPMDHRYMALFSKGADFVNRPLLSDEAKAAFAGIISDIVKEYVSAEPYYELVIKSKLLMMIAYLLRQQGTRPVNEAERAAKQSNIERVEKILQYLHDNYHTDLSMEKVAGRFYMNASYFSEYFKKSVGINFTGYLVRLRINEAIKLLEADRSNTAEIAFACGFSNLSSFYSAFRKITGANPGSYRK